MSPKTRQKASEVVTQQSLSIAPLPKIKKVTHNDKLRKRKSNATKLNLGINSNAV